ncbi:MAG: hypothetical protein RLZZ126_2086, partial [Pseudomonadota bacterium]
MLLQLRPKLADALRRPPFSVLMLVAVAALYVLLANLFAGSFTVNGRASITWFAEGFGLAAMLLIGRRCGWSVFAGEFLFRWLSSQEPLAISLAYAVGNTLAALLAVYLVHRDERFDPRLSDLRSYQRLVVLAGTTASLLSALLGTAIMVFSGELALARSIEHVFAWWVKDMVGVALVAPLFLVWWHVPAWTMGSMRVLEAALFGTMAFLCGQAVLVGWFQMEVGPFSQSYWLVALVVWGALRFRHMGVTLLLALFAVQGLLGAGHGVGLFSEDAAQTGLINYGLFLVVLSGVGMILSAYLSEVSRFHAEISARERAYYQQFAESTAVMLLMQMDGQIVDANQAALRFYGYAPEQIRRLSVRDISCRPSGSIQTSLETLGADKGNRFESRHRLADGSERDVDVSLSPIMMGDQRLIHNIVFDITDRKHAEAEIEHLAFYDPLTQLPNRRLLIDRLKQALAACARTHLHGALLFIDLDNFKTINDTHGHDKGDLLLQQTAQRLVACARAGDTVARLGGDEFVVMLRDQSGNLEEAATQVAAVGAKVLALLSQPYDLMGVDYQSS